MELIGSITRQAKEPEVNIETWFSETRLEKFAASFENVPILWHDQHIDCDGIAPQSAEYLYLLDSVGEPCAGDLRARVSCAKAICRVFCRLLRQKLRWAATTSLLDGTGEERALGMLPYWARQAERYMRYLPLVYLNTEQELKTKAEKAARTQRAKERRAQKQKSKETSKHTDKGFRLPVPVPIVPKRKPPQNTAGRLLMQRVACGMRQAAKIHGLGRKAVNVVAREIGDKETVHALWSSMRVLARAKLKALLARGDGRAQTATAHLSSLDWAVADLLMMYEYSPVQESSFDEHKQRKALFATFHLVHRFQLEAAEQEPPPYKWHEAARWYCRTYPHVVTKCLRPWSELLAADLVARPTNERGSKKRQNTAANNESTGEDNAPVIHNVATNALVGDKAEVNGEKSRNPSLRPGPSRGVRIIDHPPLRATSGSEVSSEENSNHVHTNEVNRHYEITRGESYQKNIDVNKEIIDLNAPSMESEELKRRQALDDTSASDLDTEVVKEEEDFKDNVDVNREIVEMDSPTVESEELKRLHGLEDRCASYIDSEVAKEEGTKNNVDVNREIIDLDATSAEFEQLKRLQGFDDRSASDADTEVVQEEDIKNNVDGIIKIIDLDAPSMEFEELKRLHGLDDRSASNIDTEVVKEEDTKNNVDVNREIIDLDAPNAEFELFKKLQALDDRSVSDVDTEVVKKEDIKNNVDVNIKIIDLDAPSMEIEELKRLHGFDDRSASNIDTEVVKEEDTKNNVDVNREIIDLDAPNAEFEVFKKLQALDDRSASDVDTEVVKKEDTKNNVDVNREIIDLDAPNAEFEVFKKLQVLDDGSASDVDTEVVKKEDIKNNVGDSIKIIDLDAPSMEIEELKRLHGLDDRSASNIDTEVVKEEDTKNNVVVNREIIDLDAPNAEFEVFKKLQALDDRSASDVDTEVLKKEDIKNNVDVNIKIIDLDDPSVDFEKLKKLQGLDDRSASNVNTEIVIEKDIKNNVDVNREIIDLDVPSAEYDELKTRQEFDDRSASNIDTEVVKEENIKNNVDVNREIIDVDAPKAEPDKFKSRHGLDDRTALNIVKEVVKGGTASKANSLPNSDDFATQVIRAIEQELFCDRKINRPGEANSNIVQTNEVKNSFNKNDKGEGNKNNIDVNKEIIDLDAPSAESNELQMRQVLDDRNTSNIVKEVVEGRITGKANNAPNGDDFATKVIRAIENEIFYNRSSKFSNNTTQKTTSSKDINNDNIEKVSSSSQKNTNDSNSSVADATHKHPMLTQMLQTACIFDDDAELNAFLNKNKKVYRKSNSSDPDVTSNTNIQENEIKSLVENKSRKRVRAKRTAFLNKTKEVSHKSNSSDTDVTSNTNVKKHEIKSLVENKSRTRVRAKRTAFLNKTKKVYQKGNSSNTDEIKSLVETKSRKRVRAKRTAFLNKTKTVYQKGNSSNTDVTSNTNVNENEIKSLVENKSRKRLGVKLTDDWAQNIVKAIKRQRLESAKLENPQINNFIEKEPSRGIVDKSNIKHVFRSSVSAISGKTKSKDTENIRSVTNLDSDNELYFFNVSSDEEDTSQDSEIREDSIDPKLLMYPVVVMTRIENDPSLRIVSQLPPLPSSRSPSPNLSNLILESPSHPDIKLESPSPSNIKLEKLDKDPGAEDTTPETLNEKTKALLKLCKPCEVLLERLEEVDKGIGRLAKRVELQDIDEVRRNNRRVLTAQVAPLAQDSESSSSDSHDSDWTPEMDTTRKRTTTENSDSISDSDSETDDDDDNENDNDDVNDNSDDDDNGDDDEIIKPTKVKNLNNPDDHLKQLLNDFVDGPADAECCRRNKRTQLRGDLVLTASLAMKNNCARCLWQLLSLPPSSASEAQLQQRLLRHTVLQATSTAPKVTENLNQIPSGTKQIPSETKQIPSGIEQIPSRTKQIPSAIKQIPSGTKHIPSSTKQIPSETKQIPSGTEQIPRGTKQIPRGTKQIPSRTEEIPSGTKQMPSGTKQMPSETKQIPSRTKQIPSATKQIPSGTKHIPSATKQIPSETKQIPSRTEQIPRGTKQIPSRTEEIPSGTKQMPSGTKEIPSRTKEISSGTKQITSGTKKIPSGTKQIRSGTKEIPSGTKEISSGTKQITNGTKQIPSGTEQIPSGTKQIPSGTKQIPKQIASPQSKKKSLPAFSGSQPATNAAPVKQFQRIASAVDRPLPAHSQPSRTNTVEQVRLPPKEPAGSTVAKNPECRSSASLFRPGAVANINEKLGKLAGNQPPLTPGGFDPVITSVLSLAPPQPKNKKCPLVPKNVKSLQSNLAPTARDVATPANNDVRQSDSFTTSLNVPKPSLNYVMLPSNSAQPHFNTLQPCNTAQSHDSQRAQLERDPTQCSNVSNTSQPQMNLPTPQHLPGTAHLQPAVQTVVGQMGSQNFALQGTANVMFDPNTIAGNVMQAPGFQNAPWNNQGNCFVKQETSAFQPVMPIKANQPNQMYIQPNQLNPMQINQNQPNPMYIQSNQPNPMQINQNQPWHNQGNCVVKQETSAFQPVMPVNANQPNPMYIQPNQPNPMYIQQNQPNLMQINQNQPNPMQINQYQPNSMYIQPNNPNPMQINQNQPNSMYIQPNQPNPMYIQPNQPNPMYIQPKQPNPIHINQNQPNPMHIQPNQPNQMYIQPNQPNPMYMNPNQHNPIQSESMNIKTNQPNLIRPDPMYINLNQSNAMQINPNQPNPIYPNQLYVNPNQLNPMHINPNQPNPIYIDQNQLNLMNPTQINQPTIYPNPMPIKMEQVSSYLPPVSHPNPYGTDPGYSSTVPMLGNSTLTGMSDPNTFNSMNAGSLQTLFNSMQEQSQSQSYQRPPSYDEALAVLAGSQQGSIQGPSQCEDSKPTILAVDVKIGYCDSDNELYDNINSFARLKWSGKPLPSHSWATGRDASRLAVLCTRAHRDPWALLGRYLVLSEEQPPPPNFNIWALNPRVRLRLPHEPQDSAANASAAQPARLSVKSFTKNGQENRQLGQHAYAKVKLSDNPLVYAKLLVSLPSANVCRQLLKRGGAIQLYDIETFLLHPILSQPTGPGAQFSLSGDAPALPALQELARQLQD